ncbi:hypothetical protein TNCV_237461 [Trichonephila clavipes]|nr:hypothetical protein TNCV_237461 [Trichonephila clavipes]
MNENAKQRDPKLAGDEVIQNYDVPKRHEGKKEPGRNRWQQGNTVWQKLFVKPLMKMMEKRDLAVAVDGSWQKRGEEWLGGRC